MSRYGLIIMLLFAAFGAYHLPWTLHETAVFSNNVFDLAELMSLHPSVQAESPALYTSLLLRLIGIVTVSVGWLSRVNVKVCDCGPVSDRLIGPVGATLMPGGGSLSAMLTVNGRCSKIYGLKS